MEDNERLMTRMVRILLENAVITFGGAALGGLALGPSGLALGASAASGLHLVASEGLSTWNQLRAAKSWGELILLTLKVAAELAIKNIDILYKLAIAIARLLERIFNSNHALPISR